MSDLAVQEMRAQRSILQNIDCGVVIVDVDRRVTGWNEFMAVRSGRTVDDIIGGNLYELFPELPKSWIERKLRAVFMVRSYSFTKWHERPFLFKLSHGRDMGDSKVRWMRQNCTFAPIGSVEEDVKAVCITVVDATDAFLLQMNLKRTITGSIQTILDLLGISHPTAFARAARCREYVSSVAAHLQLRDPWKVEMAALLSQLGSMSLKPELLDRFHSRRALSDEDWAELRQVPSLSSSLLSISGISSIRAMLQVQGSLTALRSARKDHGAEVGRGSSILHAAFEFDNMVSRGTPPDVAIARMRENEGTFSLEVLEALEADHDKSTTLTDFPISLRVTPVELSKLKKGMVLGADVRTASGTILLVARHALTELAVHRLQMIGASALDGPVLIQSREPQRN